MALTPLAIIKSAWTQRPPRELEDIAAFIAREGLPQWALTRQLFNALCTNLNGGTLQIAGALIRFGTGAPTAADPDGSFYFQADGPSTGPLYFRSAGAWVPFYGVGANLAANIAALRTKTSSTLTFEVQGYYTAADGGGGFFDYVPSDTTSADNGGTIIVRTDGRRYYRRDWQHSQINVRHWGIVDDHYAIVNGIASYQNKNRDQGHLLAKWCYSLAVAGYALPDVFFPAGFYTFARSTVTYTGGAVVGRQVTYGVSWPAVRLVGEIGAVVQATDTTTYAVFQFGADSSADTIQFSNCAVGIQLVGWGTYGTGDVAVPGNPASNVDRVIDLIRCDFTSTSILPIWRDKTPLSAPSFNRSMQYLLRVRNCDFHHTWHVCWIDNDIAVFSECMFAWNQSSSHFLVDSLGMPLGVVNHAQGHCIFRDCTVESEGDTVGTRSALLVGKALFRVSGMVMFDLAATTYLRLRSADNTYQGIGEAAQTLDGDDPPGGLVVDNSDIDTNLKNVVEIYGSMPAFLIFKSCRYGTNPSIGIAVNSDTITPAEILGCDAETHDYRFEREDWGTKAQSIRYASEANMLNPVGTGGVTDITSQFTWMLRPNGTELIDCSPRNNLHTLNTAGGGVDPVDPASISTASITTTAGGDTSTGYSLRTFTSTASAAFEACGSGNLANLGAGVYTYSLEISATAEWNLFFFFSYNGVQSNSRYVRVLKGRHRYWVPFYMPALSGGDTFIVGARQEAIPTGAVMWRALPGISAGYGPAPWTYPVDNGAAPTTHLVSPLAISFLERATAAPAGGHYNQGDIVWNTTPAAAGNPIGWVCTVAGSPGTFHPFGVLT